MTTIDLNAVLGEADDVFVPTTAVRFTTIIRRRTIALGVLAAVVAITMYLVSTLISPYAPMSLIVLGTLTKVLYELMSGLAILSLIVAIYPEVWTRVTAVGISPRPQPRPQPHRDSPLPQGIIREF